MIPEELKARAYGARYGEPTDTYTWDCVVDKVLETISPILDAYHNLYNVVWNETATVDIDLPGYNGISYSDSIAIEEAGDAVESLLTIGTYDEEAPSSQM